jgi:hypothetical protein
MKEKLKNVFYRIWYWYLSTIDKNAEVIFMNYGYSKNNHKIKLYENDEKNRYSAQLTINSRHENMSTFFIF